jgi:hypothetical protein
MRLQQFDNLRMPSIFRDAQRRIISARLGMDVRPSRQQQLDDFRMAVSRRHEQRSGTMRFVGSIDIGLVCQKQLHNLGMAILRRHPERCDAVCLPGGIDIGIVRQKQLHHASNNLAKNWPSLDNIIPRARLRSRYGEGWSPP